MRLHWALVLALTACPVWSQDTVITSPIDGSQAILTQPDIAASSIRAVEARGAELRGLDKVSGEVLEMDLAIGDVVKLGKIAVRLGACRYPEDNQAGEAFAWIEVTDPRRESPLFEGWMSSSSPALNALDHARYDVWVIRCTTA
ncbi:MAG: DUF2155 domain-containing protein [Boseongicola sp.]